MNVPAKNLSLACLLALVALSALLAFGHPFLAGGGVWAVYAALFLPWAGLVALGEEASPKWSHLIAAALLARVVLLFAEPVLSDDIFRYVWDGRVGFDGINPYVHAPAADALAHLRDPELWTRINHPDVPTIYPPAAQMLFWLNAALGGGTTLLRVFLLAIEAGAAALVWLILTRTGASPSAAALKRAFVVYALCPLVIVEIAWSGHVDVLAWMGLIASLVVIARAEFTGAAAFAGALLGLSIAAKFLGLIALPLVLFAKRSPVETSIAAAVRRRAVFVAIAALTVAASYLPYLDAGPKLFSGFGTYASTWQGNDGPFRAATHLAERSLDAGAPPFYAQQGDAQHGDARQEDAPHEKAHIGRTVIERVDDKLIFHFSQHDELFEKMGWTRTWQGRQIPSTSFAADQLAQAIAKALAAFLVGLAMLWALFVRREPIAGALLVLLTLFFVAPVVHPWYVAWLLPFAGLVDSRLVGSKQVGSKTAIVFSFVVLAAYVGWVSAQSGGSWQVPGWLVAVEFGVVGVVWVWEVVEVECLGG